MRRLLPLSALLAASLAALAAESPTVDTAVAPQARYQATVQEGTWMDLDVSPDGRSIAFSLLGQIYVMPITGGPATRLSGDDKGWHMHPRYSPDGQRIAFTSDLGGGDNLWVMDADGQNARQISQEDFRLVAQPDWTPDGRFVYGRKHFTGTRSLGTGEIWAWPVDGQGSGVQWTERGHLEADVNEPHLDPSGLWLYTTERGPFEYNRDPYSGIYRVSRRHMVTGETEFVAGGYGGAIRPQVSPDGTQLGYLRRHPDGLRDELVVRDLVTGAEAVWWDGLDRDQQETWANFGAYPTWAWTPDGDAVLFAQGGFFRVSEPTESDPKVERIAFSAQIDRSLDRPHRVQREASPETVEAKVVRWPRRSSQGDWVFQALGRIWVQEVGQAPKAISDPSSLAYAPAWSPDGSELVYVVWDDDKGGALIRQPLNGAPQRVTTEPGLAMSPSFSQDGEALVWLQDAGQSLRDRPGSVGSFRVLWSAGEDTHDAGTVANLGSGVRTPRPELRGDRILFTDRVDGDIALVSVDLQGHDRRVLATGGSVAEIQLSPDGQWIAWKDRHQAYVAPMPITAGNALNLDSPGVPKARLSGDLGEWLDWEGTVLSYAAGPTVWSVDLAQGLPESASAPEVTSTRRDPWPVALPEPVGVEQQLSVSVDRPQHSELLALVGAQVIPVVGDPIPDGVVLVQGERILAVGARSEVEIPAGAQVLELPGHSVFPGLVDVHAHMGFGWADVSPETVPAYTANLAYGVTTTHDPSANTHFVFAQHELVEAGRIVGPRVLSTGGILYGADSDDKAIIESLDDARGHLSRMARYGAFSVKSYNQPRRDQRRWVLQAAAERDMLVMPEGGSTLAHNLTMILDGHSGIEHALPVEQLAADVVGLWEAAEGVFYTPTLLVGYGGLMGEHAFYQRQEIWKEALLQAWTPRGELEAKGKRRTMAPPEDWQHVRLAATAKTLSEAGVRVNLGAHGQLQGLGPHWELWGLVDGGWDNAEALRAATLNGAAYLGMDGDIGSLEPGKLAELVVVEGDPLTDIHDSAQVRHVLVRGRLLDPMTLQASWPAQDAGPQVTRWWEDGRVWLPWEAGACAHSHN